MGFNLKVFMEELQYMVVHCTSHIELLEFINRNKQYAEECGLL